MFTCLALILEYIGILITTLFCVHLFESEFIHGNDPQDLRKTREHARHQAVMESCSETARLKMKGAQ
jgi:hypothetical protein